MKTTLKKKGLRRGRR